MKKIFVIVAAMAMAVSAFAQPSVGVGYANSTSKIGDSTKKGAENGFYVEGNYAFNFGNFAVVPGLRYTYLNSTNVADFGIIGVSGKLNEHYLGVPVYGQYNFDLGAAKLFLFAGPTFNFALSSKTTGSAVIAGASASKSFDNIKDGSLSPADVLVGGGVGLAFNGIQIKVGYDYGLIDRNTTDVITRHDSLLHAGVAFSF